MSPSLPRPVILANAIGYQLVWLACVGGAASGRVWPGVVASLLFVAAMLRYGGRWRADLRTLAIVLPLGLCVDSAFAALGWLGYEEAGAWFPAAPAWILAIWIAFAMTLNHSLEFLRRHGLAAALLGLAGGPLAYWSASRAFGAVSIADPVPAVMLALGLCWAVLLPTIFLLDARLPRLRASA